MLASNTFILIRTGLRLLHFSLLLLFVYLFQPRKLWNLFRLVLGAPHSACTNSGFSLLESATIIITICVPFTWNLVIIICLICVFIIYQWSLPFKAEDWWRGISYILHVGRPLTPWPMTHVGRPLTHLTSSHFNLDPRALLRMKTDIRLVFTSIFQ